MSASIEIGSILLMLVVVFFLARISSAVFNRFGLPGLIGEILIGVVIANLAFGSFDLMELLGLKDDSGDITTNKIVLDTLAELGVIFLLFSVGLETRVKQLMSVGKAAFLVATLGVIVPFVCGYLFIMIEDGGNTMEALFIGAAMVATSVGITARVIKDMKLTETKEARIIIGAAVIDDILGMIILAIVAGMASSPSGDVSISEIAVIAGSAVIFVIIVLLFCAKGVPKISEYMEARKKRWQDAHPGEVPRSANKLALAIIVCLALAALSQIIGLAAIIGAFLAGMIFADYAWEWDLEHKVESLNVFLVSFFFVNVGLNVDLSSITTQVLLLAVAIIVIAIVTKYVGCYIGTKIGDPTLDKNSANIIGIGMVPRGEVGIIVASLGFTTYAAITQDLYTVIVLMSVVTTLIAPFFLSRAFRKKYAPEYVVTADDMV